MSIIEGPDLEGTVTQFDAHRGLGEVTATDGTVYLFHCVEIADGTRDIEVGTPVTFGLMLKLGNLEARSIRRSSSEAEAE